MSKLIQQGDVLFHKVGAIPADAKTAKSDPRGLVFAKGDATGNYHRCSVGGATLLECEGTLFLEVSKAKDVHHQEHATVTLGPGLYKIGIVRTIDPFTKEIEDVRD